VTMVPVRKEDRRIRAPLDVGGRPPPRQPSDFVSTGLGLSNQD
jgi:hypothetical protein